ncbi:hypothetical protein B0H19DRAFT_1274550 [Mycena capillaripes]|nr:hypothetical protein B0H19DRAFT_1274550 [Mycena capillaripes]
MGAAHDFHILLDSVFHRRPSYVDVSRKSSPPPARSTTAYTLLAPATLLLLAFAYPYPLISLAPAPPPYTDRARPRGQAVKDDTPHPRAPRDAPMSGP